MNKKMLMCIVLAFTLVANVTIPAIAVSPNDSSSNASSPTNSIPTGCERAAAAWESAGLAFVVDGNSIRLVNPSEENVLLANKVLTQSFHSPKTRISYPTEWVPNSQYNTRTTKKLQKAYEDAVNATAVAWVYSICSLEVPSIKGFVGSFIAGYVISLFESRNEVPVYLEIKYYYRELGPGHSTDSGLFLGDFENRRDTRMTLNSNYSGGEVDRHTQRDTCVLPM